MRPGVWVPSQVVGLGAIMQDGQGAGNARKGAAKRQGARPLGSGKAPVAKKLRQQFHLGEQVVQRLGVHCSMCHRDKSAFVEEILGSWLIRYGKGKEAFPSDPEELSDPASDPT